MQSTLPRRGLITDFLVAQLTTNLAAADSPVLIGDGIRPKEAGWAGDTPGQGVFVASVLVETLEAVPAQTETLRGQGSSWKMPYRLSTAGGTRKQADDGADDVRAAVLAIAKGALLEGWQLQQVLVPRMAPVARENPSEHSAFLVPDAIELWVARSRG